MSEDVLVVNRENDITYGFEKEAKAEIREFSSKRVLNNGAYFNEWDIIFRRKSSMQKRGYSY